MNSHSTDKLVEEIRKSPTLASLETMAKTVAGTSLVILLRRGTEVSRLGLLGDQAELPEFCTRMRADPEGKKSCMACRSLVALGASYRGVSEFACHGGTSVN